MKTLSPLRYPGGKTILRLLISEILATNKFKGTFVEVYGGGAGLGLWLLINDKINNLIINDKDEFIYSFWYSAINQTADLIELIKSTPITLNEWTKQRAVITDKEGMNKYSILQIGFAALFLNRCNRSGIIRGDVGPIGGKRQLGNWKIDARFNREQIITKIIEIKSRKDQITILNSDAINCITSFQNDTFKRIEYLFYLDPPYYKNGDSLYRSYYIERDHIELHNFLVKNMSIHWILSYDSADFIKNLYRQFQIHEIKINHHAHKVKNGTELLITAPNVTWPLENET